MTFVSVMNHSLSSEQKEDAIRRWGEDLQFIEIPFPNVPPDLDSVGGIAADIVGTVEVKARDAGAASVDIVLIQGEPCVVMETTKRLQAKNVSVVCATTERIVEEKVLPDGVVEKKSTFHHVRFREHPCLINLDAR